MPATDIQVRKNYARMTDPQLKDLMDEAIRNNSTGPPEDPCVAWVPAWNEFIKAADAQRIAHKIPGAVGRRFANEYGIHFGTKRAGQQRLPVAEVQLSPAQSAWCERWFGGRPEAKVDTAPSGKKVLFIFSPVKAAKRINSCVLDLEGGDSRTHAKAVQSAEAILRKFKYGEV